MYGLDGLRFEDFFELKKSSYNLRRHDKQLVEFKFSSNVRKYSFSRRVAIVWNKLPQKCVSAPSLSSFKTNLTSVDLSKFLKYKFE